MIDSRGISGREEQQTREDKAGNASLPLCNRQAFSVVFKSREAARLFYLKNLLYNNNVIARAILIFVSGFANFVNFLLVYVFGKIGNSRLQIIRQ